MSALHREADIGSRGWACPLRRQRQQAHHRFDGCRTGVSAYRARNCATLLDMLKRETFPVANIYVPTARRKTLDLKRVDAIAHSMLKEGQQTPILVRADGARFVLVEGLHRLEGAKALGEATIVGYRVDARKH